MNKCCGPFTGKKYIDVQSCCRGNCECHPPQPGRDTWEDIQENQRMMNNGIPYIPQKRDTDLVVLAEEGTPLAQFQKDRTDAISAMFDRDKMCGQIHTTSKFFAALDKSVASLLIIQRATLLQEIRDDVTKLMQDTRPVDVFTGERVETYGYEETHNAALKEVLRLLSEKETV